jgi:hypothetical protein
MPCQKKNIIKVREKLLNYKKNICCAECGLQDHRVMEFHHIKEKKYTIGLMPNQGYCWETIKKEIDKCIPLCSNCHRIVHYKE